MKSFRIPNWRYIRPALFWTIFFMVICWYYNTNKKSHQSRSFLRPNSLIEARRKQFHPPSSAIMNSSIKRSSVFIEQVNSGGDIQQKQVQLNKEKMDNELEGKTWSYEAHDGVPTFNDQDTDDEEGIYIEKNFEFETSISKDTTQHLKWSNDNDDFSDERNDDNKTEEKQTRTPQSILLISSLRSHISNPTILRSGRLHWTIAMIGGYSQKLFSPPPNEMPTQRFPKISAAVHELRRTGAGPDITFEDGEDILAIIIGFGKCGTRALVDFLSIHPKIVTTGPEIHFFDYDENFKKGLDWYRNEMPLSYSNQMTVEKTPSYIWSQRALDEIYKLNKHMKLIVIIKDPVSRIVSQAIRSNQDINRLCMIEKNGVLQVNNKSRTLQWSMYARYLQPWLRKFSTSQVHVLEANEFARSPAQELNKIETFLGVPNLITEKNFYFNKTKGFYCMRPFHVDDIICLTDGKGKPHPQLPHVVEKTLYDYFHSYNEELFHLIGKKYQWLPVHSITNINKEKLSRANR